MLKIGEMYFELCFDPVVHTRAHGSFSPELFRENRLVSFVGIDTKTELIRTLRAATYPRKFLESLYLAYQLYEPKLDYGEFYKGLTESWEVRSLPQSWQLYHPCGMFGGKMSEE
jgi:hypothetical protein